MVECVTRVPAVTHATARFAAGWLRSWVLVILARLIGWARSWRLLQRGTDSARKAHTRSCSAGTDSAPWRTPRVKESITEGIGAQIVDVPMSEKVQECVSSSVFGRDHGGGEFGPTGTRATTGRRATCGRAQSTY